MNAFWEGRGAPGDYDPGPPRNRKWPRLFAETPNYRGLSLAVLEREKFRWHFGPMFYRGRLRDRRVKVLVIGQEGAQDESLAHRAFTGSTGARLQHFLNHLGITRSYLFLNSFVYPIFGQYTSSLRWLAQDPGSPVVAHRHRLFDYALVHNDVHLVVAVGRAAKESVVTWVASRGGTCPLGAEDLSQCDGRVLGPHTRLLGVLHPGGAGQDEDAEAAKEAIIADFQRAVDQVAQWAQEDPAWLPSDPGGVRRLGEPYTYERAPIPLRDFPFGIPLRLGRGGTTSNRKDEQRAIQIFSADGRYNNWGDELAYEDLAEGSPEGYAEAPGDVPYEPPKEDYRAYDSGPGRIFARLFMGAYRGLAWPDFQTLGATAHPSFGHGPLYRGRPAQAAVLVYADQQAHDDLFTGRALTGESGQHLQAFLEAIGLTTSYVILRPLPVDTLDLAEEAVATIVRDAQVRQLHQAVADRIRARSEALGLVLTFGPAARVLAEQLDLFGLPVVSLKAWKAPGALADWQQQLGSIQAHAYPRDLPQPAFAYDGRRGQIPRADLPYGTPRWVGTSGDRARRPVDGATQTLSPHYYKLHVPDWVFQLGPAPLSPAEQAAVQDAP